MSGGAACKCGKRSAWRVVTYRGNHSAFSGRHFTSSAYSAVYCDPDRGGCSAYWRTKARYVDTLPR